MLLASAGSVWVSDAGLNRVPRISPARNRVTAVVHVDFRPFGLAFGAGSLWTACSFGNSVVRISPRTNKVTATIRVGAAPYDVVFGAASAWASNERANTVSRIDPRTNRVVATIKVGARPNGLAYAFGAIWVADLDGNAAERIDPASNRVTARIQVRSADWITPSADALWVSSEQGFVARVDPAAGAVAAKVDVGANPLASGWVARKLWVPNIDGGTISVIDRASALRHCRAGSERQDPRAPADDTGRRALRDGAPEREPAHPCVNRALATLKANGTLKTIETTWLSKVVGVPVLK